MPFTPRAKFDWHLRSRLLPLGEKTLVMGVLNVTPDSFSDGGLFHRTDNAIKHGLQLLDEGADILDIGGESTRPGQQQTLSAEEELDRVLPVISGILKERPWAILSIDTYKAATAAVAIRAGAEIVNDVSGFLWDSKMARVCAALQCGVVLMHTRGKSDEWRALPPLAPEEVLPLVKNGLQDRLQSAFDAGVMRERIVLDPGYGFGKRLSENYPLLARQEELLFLGQPLLAGVSRKSFLANTLKKSPDDAASPDARLHTTIAATTAAILAGASIVRVHDVLPAVEAARIADAILAAG